MSISIFKKSKDLFEVFDSYRGGLWQFAYDEIISFLNIIRIIQEKKDFNSYVLKEIVSDKDRKVTEEVYDFIKSEEIPTMTTFIAKAVLDGIDDFLPGIITAPFVNMEISRICNYNCYWCFLDYKGEKQSLKLEELCQFIVDPMLKLGTYQWGITGGEPSLNLEKLVHISKYIYDNSMRYYSIEPEILLFTNGHQLAENAQNYRNAGITAVQVSLSSTDPELDKRLRKPPNGVESFENVRQGIRRCREVGLNVNLNSVISPDIGYGTNIDTIQAMFRFAKDEKVDVFDLSLACPSGEAKKNRLTYSKKDYDVISDLLSKGEKYLNKEIYYSCPSENLEENRDISCGTGMLEFYIDHLGYTYPCNNLSDKELRCSQQTVLKENIQHIWLYSDVLAPLRKYDQFNVCSDCGICTYRGFCVGSCKAKIWHQYNKLDLREKPEYCYKDIFEERR